MSDTVSYPSRGKLILSPEMAFGKRVQGRVPSGKQLTGPLGNLCDRWGYCLQRQGLDIKLPLWANLSGGFRASKSWASQSTSLDDLPEYADLHLFLNVLFFLTQSYVPVDFSPFFLPPNGDIFM